MTNGSVMILIIEWFMYQFYVELRFQERPSQ